MKTRKGFTLLEMLIVIGIIAILVGVMMTSFSGSSDSARAAQCLNNMRSLSNAVIAFTAAYDPNVYPAAGTYKYLAFDSRKGGMVPLTEGGWIGLGRGDSEVGSYYADDDKAQYYAITNGVIWRYIRGGRSSYTCPTHVLAARKEKLTPAWSYVMNSYFGWKVDGKPAKNHDVRRRRSDMNLPFYYKASNVGTLSRSPSKTLLFAEMPFVEQPGLQTAQFSTGSGIAFDAVLQYDANEEGLNPNLSSAANNGQSESIGFNHRNGKHGDYMAHVAFADGHVEKIPLRGGAADIKKLTTYLCAGRGYTLTAKGYEKAD